MLNPNKFLPLATGAFVIVGFMINLYYKINSAYYEIRQVVSSDVDHEVCSTLAEETSMNRLNPNKDGDQIDSVAKTLFHNSLNKLMKAQKFELLGKFDVLSIIILISLINYKFTYFVFGRSLSHVIFCFR